ncbi:hypothetical protein WJX79_008227 [Trebouxia sp. C0005]
MQRGGKKSPFLGRTERMESASQLLYPRYRSLSDAFLYPDGAAVPITPTQINTGSIIKARQHTLPVQVSLAPVHVQAASPPVLQSVQQPILQSTEAVKASEEVKKPKKKKRKVKEDPIVKASGPSNAEEAQLMRNVLGFTATPPATDATPLTSLAHPSSASLTAAQPQAQPHQTAVPATAPVAAQAGVEGALPAPPAGPASSEYVARRVFVGGMPFSYEVDAIREYWSFCGEIEDLDVMRFPDTGRFKGIAFITYATEEGYLEALKCDGTDLDGQQLRVQKCMSAGAHVPKKKQMAAAPDAVASPAQQQQSPAPKVAGYHVAYVGNLAFEATDAEIQQLFPDCNVTKVRLHTDKNTGKSRGFAHVHFLDEPSLDKALQFNGSLLHGRQVKVSYAQPKKGS